MQSACSGSWQAAFVAECAALNKRDHVQALLDLVKARFKNKGLWKGFDVHCFMEDFDDHGFRATRVSSSGLIKYVHPSVKRVDDVGSLTPTATKRKAAGTTGDAAPKRGKASL